jgi:hypothetical protein
MPLCPVKAIKYLSTYIKLQISKELVITTQKNNPITSCIQTANTYYIHKEPGCTYRSV